MKSLCPVGTAVSVVLKLVTRERVCKVRGGTRIRHRELCDLRSPFACHSNHTAEVCDVHKARDGTRIRHGAVRSPFACHSNVIRYPINNRTGHWTRPTLFPRKDIHECRDYGTQQRFAMYTRHVAVHGYGTGLYDRRSRLMLCGELVRSPLSFHSSPRSPYVALLALCQGMAAITAPAPGDDQDIFLGNQTNSHEIRLISYF
ncbi:hypothetical protein J6590_044161 [Homalodisca vitripennis]|nr:hypothetical protein J6590_044161 [Homalodisca vitripennis]